MKLKELIVVSSLLVTANVWARVDLDSTVMTREQTRDVAVGEPKAMATHFEKPSAVVKEPGNGGSTGGGGGGH